MEPGVITSTDWYSTALILGVLFAFTALIILAALVFLTSHAVIPSLEFTYQLPPRVNLLRPALYAIAAVLFVLGLLCFGIVLVNAYNFLSQFYPKWWI